MSWYSIVVTPAEISQGKNVAIEEAFESTYIAQSAPRGAELWATDSIETGNVTYYLSPVGYQISRISMLQFAPVQCATPNGSSLHRRIGQ